MLFLPPFTVGATATLYAPSEYVCTVTDPDGITVKFETPFRRVDIPLLKVGTYVYGWQDGTTGEFIVRDVEPPTMAAV